MSRSVLAALLLISSSCSAGGKPPPPAAPPPAPAANAVVAPLRVSWNVLSDDGRRLVVEAVITRKTKLNVPIAVHVEIPSGLTLVVGEPSFQPPANLPGGENVYRFEFTYEKGAPPTDLKLVADAYDVGMGVHASDAYRFGRKAEELKPPVPSGPDVHYGDKNLGPPITLDPPSTK